MRFVKWGGKPPAEVVTKRRILSLITWNIKSAKTNVLTERKDFIHSELNQTLRNLFLEVVTEEAWTGLAFCTGTKGSSFQRHMPPRTTIWPHFISSSTSCLAANKDGLLKERWRWRAWISEVSEAKLYLKNA